MGTQENLMALLPLLMTHPFLRTPFRWELYLKTSFESRWIDMYSPRDCWPRMRWHWSDSWDGVLPGRQPERTISRQRPTPNLMIASRSILTSSLLQPGESVQFQRLWLSPLSIRLRELIPLPPLARDHEFFPTRSRCKTNGPKLTLPPKYELITGL